jgi:hypothetical protein
MTRKAYRAVARQALRLITGFAQFQRGPQV